MVTIIIGALILLLIWKVCAIYRDRKEYERFIQEKKEAEWSKQSNPLYKSAVTNFQNPLYSGS